MVDAPIIKVRGLVTRFGTNTIHDGLDLDVRRGEILGIVGGSGTGKSVLLRTIVGLLTPAAGTVEVAGIDVHRATGPERAALEGIWGVMFQDGALFSTLTVRENVEVPMRGHPLTPEARQGIADLKIAMAGLPFSAGGKYPSQLSGGMRKRAGLARALALDPQILFLDSRRRASTRSARPSSTG